MVKKIAMCVRLDEPLKMRLVHQGKRLCMNQNSLIKMALVKLLEEEEQLEQSRKN